MIGSLCQVIMKLCPSSLAGLSLTTETMATLEHRLVLPPECAPDFSKRITPGAWITFAIPIVLLSLSHAPRPGGR